MRLIAECAQPSPFKPLFCDLGVNKIVGHRSVLVIFFVKVGGNFFIFPRFLISNISACKIIFAIRTMQPYYFLANNTFFSS